MTVLALTSHALTDRVLAHTEFARTLAERGDVRIWAASAENPRYREMWARVPARVEQFPKVMPFPEAPINLLRRVNDFAWDFRLRDPSRLSMMRHIRDKAQVRHVRAMKAPGRLIAAAGLNERFESRLERMMIACERSPEARDRLRDMRPELVVSMGPLGYEEPAVTAAAKKLGIPVIAFVTSWDNLSIKHRMVFRYDGYLVWSERMKQELLERYAQSRRVPVHVVGAPQFDLFFRPQFRLTRQEFCERYGFTADRPLIVHALGVANNIDERYAALDLARRVSRGELGDAQLIVRPHPFLNHAELRPAFREFGPRVALQQNGEPSEKRTLRSQDGDGVTEWVNTFRHADVVVHLSSTVAIDAAIFDRPSVCLDYDPMPGGQRQQLVREVNHLWTHYKPVAESGGMWLASSPDEVAAAILEYLRNPGLHREARRSMAECVCGRLDGWSGVRLAEAVAGFLHTGNGRAVCEVTRR